MIPVAAETVVAADAVVVAAVADPVVVAVVVASAVGVAAAAAAVIATPVVIAAVVAAAVGPAVVVADVEAETAVAPTVINVAIVVKLPRAVHMADLTAAAAGLALLGPEVELMQLKLTRPFLELCFPPAALSRLWALCPPGSRRYLYG